MISPNITQECIRCIKCNKLFGRLPGSKDLLCDKCQENKQDIKSGGGIEEILSSGKSPAIFIK